MEPKLLKNVIVLSIFMNFMLSSCNNGSNVQQDKVNTSNNLKLKSTNPDYVYNQLNNAIGLPSYGRPADGNQGLTPPIAPSIIPISTFFYPVTNYNVNFAAYTNQDIQSDSTARDSMAVLATKNNGVFTAFIDPVQGNSLSLVQYQYNSADSTNFTPWNHLSNNNVSHINMSSGAGNVYIAYKDGQTGFAGVKMYGPNNQNGGSNVTTVGSNGGNISNGLSIRDIAIASNDSGPVVAYIANLPSRSQALQVANYSYQQGNNERNNWKALGQNQLNNLIESQVGSSGLARASVNAISIAMDGSNNIYVAFTGDGLEPGAQTSSLNVLEYNVANAQWLFIGGGNSGSLLVNPDGTNPPVINNNGAYETKMAVTSDGNLVLAYVDRKTHMLRVQKYIQPTGGNEYGTWGYVGSTNTSVNTQLSGGYVTGKDIAKGDSISLALAPIKVVNPTNAGQIENYLYRSDQYCEYCGGADTLSTANQAIIISFRRLDNGDSSAAMLAYDGNAWEYIGPGGSSGMNKVYATDVSIDQNTGYIYLGYIMNDGRIYTKYSPQNPYNKIAFETNTQVQADFEITSPGGGNHPITSLKTPAYSNYCISDANNPFGPGNTSVNVNLKDGQYLDGEFLGNQFTYLLAIQNNDGSLWHGPTTVGFNYYNLNNQFLITETGSYFGSATPDTQTNLANPININATTTNVWTGAPNQDSIYETCSNWTSNNDCAGSIGNSSEYNGYQTFKYYDSRKGYHYTYLNWWHVTFSNALARNHHGVTLPGGQTAALYCVGE